MKYKTQFAGITLLATSVCASFGQATGLGLKFAATDPSAEVSSLLPEESAGVVPQANWNNLTGASGTNSGTLNLDNGGTAAPSTASVTWTSQNTWRSTTSAISGNNNAFPQGGNRKLMSGYLDTGNQPTNGITITVTNIDASLAANGYDVYVYFLGDSGTAGRGGTYTINTGSTNFVKYGSTASAPTTFVEDAGTDVTHNIRGTHVRFPQLTGAGFTLTAIATTTTSFRAPINAIQIVPTRNFGPEFTTQPVNVEIYAGRTVRLSGTPDGYPYITGVKWQKGGVDVVNDARISGATSNTLVISNVTAGDIGNYTLVATSPRGTTTSDTAKLSVVTQDNNPYTTSIVNAAPLAHWAFNDESTDTNAYEHLSGLTGAYRDNAVWGSAIEGPRATAFPGFGAANTAVQPSNPGLPGYVGVPAPTLSTNSATIVAWINPSQPQASYTGIFSTRTPRAAGLNYTTGNQLAYTWNNNSAATYNFNSGLIPPDNEWTMVALVVEPTKATIYMVTNGIVSAAVNPIPHVTETFGGFTRIGDDTGGTGRQFIGRIDEVSVFSRSLSFQDVANLYASATGVPQNPAPIVSPQPVGATLYAGATATFRAGSAGATSFSWKRGSTTLADDTRISGSGTETLTVRNLTLNDAGEYTFTATNPNGSVSSVPVTLTVLPATNAYVAEVISNNPLSYWRLNDTSDPTPGTAPLLDLWGSRNGTYGSSAFNAAQGVEGPRPPTFGGFEADNGALQSRLNQGNSWGTVPGPGISTNTATFVAWINPLSRVNNAGIVFARAGQAATGLGLSGTGNIGYTWLDQAATYNFNPTALQPRLNEWSLAAVVVEPTRAIVYLIDGTGLKSATNTTTHNVRAFTDTIRIGGDPNNNNRTFDGKIDEVAFFDRALSSEQLNRLFQRGLGSVAPTIVASPVSREDYPNDTVTFTVSAVGTAPLTYRWERLVGDTFQVINNGGRYSGADTGTLTITGVTNTDATQYRAIVSNALGSGTSDAASFTVLEAPAVPGAGTFGGAIIGSNPFSYYRFNEMGDPSSGTLKAYDFGGNHATYGAASANGLFGVAGPRPADGFTRFEETNTALGTAANVPNAYATAPAMNITNNSMTIMAWINPATLVNNSGIVFWRAGQPATGLNLNGTGNIGYHWSDTAATYNWNSGLTPPLGQWSLAVVSIEPTRAIAYLITTNGVQSATNNVTHAVRAFTDTLRIGGDPLGNDRIFNGAIDEVAIFDTALSAAQVQDIYNGNAAAFAAELRVSIAAGGQVTISWDGPGQLQSKSVLDGQNNWENVTTTGSTYTTTPATTGNRFFRVVR